MSASKRAERSALSDRLGFAGDRARPTWKNLRVNSEELRGILSEGFTKLFGSLIHSTVWREPNHVRLVWITMLAIVNRDGFVEASLPGLADAARVTVEECEDALLKLKSPDKYSRSKAHDGKRVKDVDGGWELLNYQAYRERMNAADQREKTAERVRRARDRDRDFAESVTGEALHGVTERNSNECNDIAEAEAEAEADQDPPVVPRSGDAPAVKGKPVRSERRKPRHVLPDDWRPGPEHLERARSLGLNCRTEFDKFKNHALAGGRLMVNWNACFTTWLLNAQAFAPMARGGAGGGQGRGTALPEEERRIVRNRLLDDAKAGLYGPKAKQWAESGRRIGELADKLEAQPPRRSSVERQLTEGIGQ